MKKNILLICLPFFLYSFCSAANSEGGGLPVASFTYYIEFVGISADVSFFNTSTDADTYYWDLGDGSTSTDMHPFHNYALPGLYIVCLTAENDFGSSTYCDTINTYYAPSADFAYSGDPDIIFTDLTTNYPTEWYWNFGDGESSTLQNPEHIYAANGTYDVCLSASNPGGTSYTCKTLDISTYDSTIAAFTYAGDPVVAFLDASSNSPTAWLWDFADGTTSTEQNPVHSFTDNGLFVVCLTATNAGGSDTHCEEILISNYYLVPGAAFSYSNVSGSIFSFTDLSTNSPSEWLWDFADGETSNEQNPEHTFPAEGNFNVCLTATNVAGSDTVCEYIFLETGIHDPSAQSIIIFPNPASDKFIIELQSQDINADEINMYNSIGEEVKILLSPASSDKYTADISMLPAGYYLLRVNSGKLSETENILIK